MNDILIEIKQLHDNHYTDTNTNELIKRDISPNSNWIYHLYSDGEITYQKGGNAYLCRSEHTHLGPLYYGLEIDNPFYNKFPLRNYGILTQSECESIRDKMKLIFVK